MEGNDLKRVIADPNNIVKSAFASKQHGDLSNPKNRNRVNSDSNNEVENILHYFHIAGLVEGYFIQSIY